MKYRAYPEYKDSGVEWLGEVPSHWGIANISSISNKITNGFVGPTRGLFHDEGVRYLQSLHIKQNKINFHTPYYVAQEWSDEKTKSILKKGDVLVVQTGDIGQVAAVTNDFEGCNCHALIIVSTTEKIDGFYLSWLLNSDYGFHSLKSIQTGALHPHLNCDTVKTVKTPIPQMEEQQTIANFLDHETAKIDTLIEKQQLLIRLLKEKRQAVISHAVTKGLNPDAPMRDSGVEWLGEVPEGWIVRRLKHTSKLQSGIPKGKDLTGKIRINVPMLRVANVQDGYLNLEDVHNMEIEPDELERYSLENGDVLMNEGGDNDKLGRGAVWQSEIEPCIHQNHVFAIRPYSIEPEWLALVTRTSYAKFHFYRVTKQSTNLASISSTNIKETPLVIPPTKERSEIIEYVMRKIAAFDHAEKKCSAQIKLLQERRTALISAAVTGKIDVRNWQAPASSSNKEDAA